MKTYSARASEIEKKWVMIDADGLVVGRLASETSPCRLRGKHKPTYTYMDCGDSVIVINAAKIVLTGAKLKKKIYYHHTGYIGGIKERTARAILAGKFPERVVKEEKLMEAHGSARAARPPPDVQSARLSRHRRIRHEAQQPEKLDVAAMNPKNTKCKRSTRPRRRRPDHGRRPASCTELVDPDQGARVNTPESEAAKADNKRDCPGPRLCCRPPGDRWRASGSSPAPARSPSTAGTRRPISPARKLLRMILRQLLIAASRDGQFDVVVTVNGGGLPSQS